ncbi:upstream stimulatory factor-like [Halichondria panicea]|uniref:upstream stimulatory factor-like n=1 Tax=Halichondria panicea TaxID=6063 RepID=UPI00312B3066
MAANREAQRKATHNEVERWRRDRINELIKVLAQIVPACQKKDATTGSIVLVTRKTKCVDITIILLFIISRAPPLTGLSRKRR